MNPYLPPLDRLEPPGDVAALLADADAFRRRGAKLRLLALACLMSARHGWLGASFSCIDILDAIHALHIPDPLVPAARRNRLVLSKGHAAAAHYAVLAAYGALPVERLLTYKDRGGLPAHVEAGTPGVDAGSGSLGQGLSKAIGMALADRARGERRVTFALLGDGELQEGQVFESLLTLAAKGLSEVVPVVDRNGLQTDSATGDVKDAADWGALFRGIGLSVIEADGHDGPSLAAALRDPGRGATPRIILARTEKGGGATLTGMRRDAPRRSASWHGRIPDDAEHAALARDLASRSGDAVVAAGVEAWLALPRPPLPAAPAPPRAAATADAFGDALVALGERFPELHVLDADLEKSCRLAAFADRFPGRFHEIGISEQDMVSAACGIGLAGGVAVANTYAAFHRRSLDQAFAAALDAAPVILAGHYAGLDYHTDGRTHQSLHDLGLVGALDRYEPLTAAETRLLLEALVGDLVRRSRAGLPARPAYVRLHRLGAEREIALPGDRFDGLHEFPAGAGRAGALLAAASPHFLVEALDLAAALGKEGLALDVAGVSAYDTRTGRLAALGGAPGRLRPRVPCPARRSPPTGSPSAAPPPLRLAPAEPCGSRRTHAAALADHGLDRDALLAALRAALVEASAATGRPGV